MRFGTPFVIFDRDGTLIEHVPHLADPREVRFKPDLISGLTELRNAGFVFGIVTNQSVVARGLATLEQVEEINSIILNHTAKYGLKFEFVHLCPHSPNDGCGCRKPNIDLGLRAIKDFNLSPKISYVVGDQESDMVFGRNLGCRVVQVKGNAEKSDLADYYSDDLDCAADWIISDMRKQGD
jgi:D-glycero-D-manno-heptose 1,7-bisphosphate phosphatase